MAGSIVGRDAELAGLRDFVGSLAGGAAALVLEGEAGMGKTTLWTAGVETARELGLLVLEARPAESETALSFSAIGDLLDRVLDEALASLPAGQRRALERALVLAEDEGPPPDPHAVGVALLGALRGLAEGRPLVVAVDDAQWLDPASANGLAYAARRLRVERVGVLVSRRSGHESTLLDELRRSLPAGRVVDLVVGPLGAAALHQLVRVHDGVTLPRPLLAEICDASGGNPFYALEIVRMLRRSGVSIEAGHRLPVPESLHDLVHGRLRALPPETRDFLLAAAAHAHPTVSITEAASGIARDVGLAPALHARIVELERDRIRFTHPLLAAGALEGADPVRRAEVHARLADLLEDPEARAWQLAAAAGGPDESVAAALEAAARHARARGAPRPAALLLDRARELTPGALPADALRRALDAAFLHFESGDSRRAEAQLRDVIAPLPAGPERARALVLLARIRLYEAPAEARALFRQVVEEAGDDRAILGLAHEGVAACSIWTFSRFDDAHRHAEIALGLADELGDSALAADVFLVRLGVEALLGRSTADATAERALVLQESALELRVLDQPLLSLAEYWTWIDEHARARAALVQLLQHAQDAGDENARPYLVYLLGDLERLLGDLESALRLAREGRGAAEQSGQPLFAVMNLALESHIEAMRGRADAARETAGRALDLGSEMSARLVASAALGHLELVSGNPASAAAVLGPCVAFVREERLVEPGATRWVVDQIEALLELGRRNEAVDLLDWYEGNAVRLDRASALAAAGRCRGLVAAAEGDVAEATAAYRRALEWHAKVSIPLEQSRTLLALGAAQRRAKHRRQARDTLEQALEIFERIGAALWAQRARAELRRISGRAPAAGALTPAEERVAALVCEGKTNREVAAALYLSERTVEGHLSRVFGKLGIAHRNQLGPALAARQTQGIAASNTGDAPVSAEPVAP